LPANSEKYPKAQLPKAGPLPVILKGQKALVTGANSGIGKAVAIALGQAGADVVVNYVRGDEAAKEVVDTIKATGRKAYAHLADVSKEDQVQGMFKKMYDEFGTIDILVNNAGLQQDANLVDMSLQQWNTVISINLTGQWLCAREAAKEFMRRGVKPDVSVAAGKIICMSSVHDVIPWAGHVNYASSKGGIMMMMRNASRKRPNDFVRTTKTNTTAPVRPQTRPVLQPKTCPSCANTKPNPTRAPKAPSSLSMAR